MSVGKVAFLLIPVVFYFHTKRCYRYEIGLILSTVKLGYNALPLLMLFSLGPLGKAHKSNICFSRIKKALPGYNALPLLTLLSLVSSEKNSGYNALPGTARRRTGPFHLFFTSPYLPLILEVELTSSAQRG